MTAPILRRYFILGLLGAATFRFVSATTPPRRAILSIGNENYRHSPSLKNPFNDAKLILEAARRAGFEGKATRDLDRTDLIRSIDEFVKDNAHADVRIIYFAGHGAIFRNKGYLLPIDAQLAEDGQLLEQALEVEGLLDRLKGLMGVSIVIIDACRSEPKRLFNRKRGRSLGQIPDIYSLDRSSSLIEPAKGIIVAYSTDIGENAPDNESLSNSIYTKNVAKYLIQPGLTVVSALQRVGSAVYSETKGRNAPRIDIGIYGDNFCLVPAPGGRCDANGGAVR